MFGDRFVSIIVSLPPPFHFSLLQLDAANLQVNHRLMSSSASLKALQHRAEWQKNDGGGNSRSSGAIGFKSRII
jgi:hypothetical protein